MRERSKAVGRWMANLIDTDDVFLVLGLVLVTVGLWPIWRVSALIVPGAVLIWLSLPARTGFLVSHPPVDVTAERPRRRAN